MQDIFRKILTSRVYEAAIETPLDHAVRLSAELDNDIYLKREDLQPVFSFKIRGAYQKIVSLSEEEKRRGVICASAGNHAQGVALSAQRLRIQATVVMPATTPGIKVNAVKSYGATVVLIGDSYSDAAEHATKLAAESGAVFIHPFDDDDVIAGQGTIGHELLRQMPDLNAVFVPVGGGGLISGIGLFLKTVLPEVKIIGVQSEDSDAMKRSVEADRRIRLDTVGIFADGVAVKEVGLRTFELARRYTDEFITVSTDEIASAIKAIYQETRSIVEPAGALAVAGLRKYVHNRSISRQRLIAINSGANMNFDRLRFVAERAMTGERREALYAVTIPEKPGSLKRFCDSFVGDRNITEFNYRLMSGEQAHIFVGIAVHSSTEADRFGQSLIDGGFPCLNLTDNELAKTHIRHMVGGRRPPGPRELLFRFEFPERPGALAQLLNSMSGSWNISLFHYRMHGGDFGRVLIGFEIDEADDEAFYAYLKNLNYSFIEETQNPAYRLFL